MTIKSIMNRKSVRNYTGETIKEEESEKLCAFIGEVNETAGVFGNKIRLRFIENTDGNGKLGTYGVINGARYFIAAACKKGAYDMEDTGYQFIRAILFATELGLNTVCIGGTFSRGGFSKAVNLQDDEVLPIVSPVGYEGGKKSLLGRIIKSNAGNRKPWGELFFYGNFNTPYPNGDEYTEVLEAVRQAPSALNAQPWRIVKDNDTAFHFYSDGKTDMNRIDMGIAICHFEIAAKEKGFTGQFQVLEQGNEGEHKYLVSWIKN